MITLEQTTDLQYINSLLFNPATLDDISDDSEVNIEEMKCSDVRCIPGFFLKVLMDGIPSGMYWLVWKGAGVEAHTILTEMCRGINAIKATRMAIEWVFKHTTAASISSFAWSDSPKVKWFCKAVGMDEKNTESWPNTRHGKHVDITYYEVKRKELP